MTLDTKSKAIIRMLIYPVQFDRNPVNCIDHVFGHAILPGLTETPEEYLAAISAALESSEQLSELIPQSHPEAVIREYLAAVRQRLETPA
jgi:hypothetical protein